MGSRGEQGDAGEEAFSDEEPSLFDNPLKLAVTALVVLALFAGIYVLIPNIIGLEDALEKMKEGRWEWFAAAGGCSVLAYFAYVAQFRGVVGRNVVKLDWRESYQITMAGLAAARIVSAGGAGGVILSYWALRKAGMQRAEAARRMIVFLTLMYSTYIIAVVVFGVLLRTGVLPGSAPVSMTIVPAAIAGVLLGAIALLALVPADLQRRLRGRAGGRFGDTAVKLSKVPETIALGVRDAVDYLRRPRKGGLAVFGAVAFWASNIGILWCSFMAFGVAVPFGVIVMGFFVGMVANLAPDPAGVGAVDGGLIGAFLIFGEPAATVIAAVLVYRLIAFWMPLPPGIVAFFQLRRTVKRWDAEGRATESEDGVEGTTADRRDIITSETEVLAGAGGVEAPALRSTRKEP